MAYLNSYRAIGSRVDRWMDGRWVNGWENFDTDKEAKDWAANQNAMVRAKRKERGLTRERTGAYGRTYPASRTRPEGGKTRRVRQTKSAQAALKAAQEETGDGEEKSGE